MFRAAVLVCLLLAPSGPAAAQGEPTEPPAASEPQASPPIIGSLRVEGAVFTDTTRILRSFDVRPGQTFAPDLIRRGLRKLGSLGLFSDYRVNQVRREGENVVDLVIVVVERPRIAQISFEGMKQREDADLEKKLFLKVGETYSPRSASNQADTLIQYYKDEGFSRAKVTSRADTLAGRNEVHLHFIVNEGEKVRITNILFQGRNAMSEAKLRKTMKTKVKGFIGGGDIKDETFAEDRERLEALYHDNGYRDAQVTDFLLSPSVIPRELTLTVRITEGRLYRQGTVAWTGNKVLPLGVLERGWSRKPGPFYNKSRIQAAVSSAYGEYAEQGYLYVGIEPREEVVRDSAVNVVFAVTEGGPSHVRRISITGNKGTREKVIRREISVHEGDQFRRSALMRSQGDIMRLGIFTNVIPDFTPAESTDVDLIFKIEEKQVGTASAGAGFTSEAGLTGFLELAHNNVLGNNQTLQLHLERGGRRQDYQLSFTEPWFRDTPTLLGFSAYNTFRVLPEYDQKRRGVSGRIGRPLPWPDYSRGSLSYTLEGLTFTRVQPGITLSGVNVGQTDISSTMEGNFIRNSTDNPFYPTRGTRLTGNVEYTGGPFGGDLNYHRHRWEGRAYLPSALKRITTMVRLRLGTVNGYPWRHDIVPDYVRFRLGGGSTPDPLRGYEDYQIVPGKFIRKDPIWIRMPIDTLTGGIVVYDSTLAGYKTTRYPGGRYMGLLTVEQQFPIAHPLHGVLFFDAGNVWDLRNEIKPFDLKVGAGIGFRMEIPLLGNIGFDYGYGFHRDDRPKWAGHFMLGNVNF